MLSTSTKSTPGVKSVVVSGETEGQRLDNFLITYLKGVPRTRVYRIVRKGEVRVNKGRVKPSYRLNEGDLIRIPPVRVSETTKPSELPQRQADVLTSAILYEDEGLIILNKPAGMAVHGGSGLSFGVIEAFRLLRPHAKTMELVHRLDKDTSGCLMIAKKKSVLKALHEQLKLGQIEKVYWALVNGQWKGPKMVDLPLLKGQLSSGERMVRVDSNGQKALTEFAVIKRYGSATLMQAKPITGRTHQIRVHATETGYAIAGDPKYGDDYFNRLMKEKGLSRLFLHARSLSLTLPGQEKSLTVEAPLDAALASTLQQLSEEIVHG